MYSTEPEIAELRERLHRYQVYLGVALAVFGAATLASVSLVGIYGYRLSNSLAESEAALAALRQEGASRTDALQKAIDAQQKELAAIREAAFEDLEAIREANRRLQSVRDPAKELTALREANEALWRELAGQRAEILEALSKREAPEAVRAPSSRFQLGETSYVDPQESADEVKGFVRGEEKIFRGSVHASNPALLVIEVEPLQVALGEPYRLSVRLVNRSNRALAMRALRLDWSFQGKNTGGTVPVQVGRVEPQETALLYSVTGQWTEAHKERVRVTATVTVDEGATVSNVLSW
jgi:hypothetical protein